jgi:myo-inositol-1(or 4)-monophosphatase
MNLPVINYQQVIDLVRHHSHTLLKSRLDPIRAHTKLDGSVVTQADLAMQNAIEQSLLAHSPQTQLLGEEMSTHQQLEILNSPQAVWILDPIDGTSNFARGLPYYCVSLALMHQGEIVWGMVYDPERDEVFHAKKGQGAFLNNQRLHAPDYELPLKQCLAGVDFKRLSKDLAIHIVTRPPYASQRSLGAIALDWCWVACGRMQVYIHGQQNLWDYAAASLILAEAQGVSVSFDGAPVLNGSLDKRSALVATSPRLMQEWKTALFG